MIIHIEFQMRKVFPHLFDEHRGVILTYIFKLKNIFSVEMFADGGVRVAFEIGKDKLLIDSELIQKEIDILLGVEVGLCPCGCGAALALGNCFVQSEELGLPLENLTRKEVDCLIAGKLIEAIKEHRFRTGASLADSKNLMDTYRDKHFERLQQIRNLPKVR